MDLFEELGVLAVGSRLKRLLERMNSDISRFYRLLGVEFEARWFPVLYLLGMQTPLTITEIADSLKLTHPAINKLVSQMRRAGLVTTFTDCQDRRKCLVELTAKGHSTRTLLEPVWEKMRATLSKLHKEVENSFLTALVRLEDRLERESLFRRLTVNIKSQLMDGVEILDYQPELKEYFKRLNLTWLKERFGLDEYDKRMLSDPEGTIIAEGGVLLFARLDERIAGTCALIRHEGGLWELAKLAVDESARERYVGTKLAVSAIHRARLAGADRILIETNPNDGRARGFFESLGFRETETNPLPVRYTRARMTMALEIHGRNQAEAIGEGGMK